MDEKLPDNVVFVPFKQAKELTEAEEMLMISKAMVEVGRITELLEAVLQPLVELTSTLRKLANAKIAKAEKEEIEE